MFLSRRTVAIFVSVGVHLGLVVLQAVSLQDLFSGGGEDAVNEEEEGPADRSAEGDELDVGPSNTKLVSIGIVVDTPAPPSVVVVAAVSPPVPKVKVAPPRPPEPVPAAPETVPTEETAPTPEVEAPAAQTEVAAAPDLPPEPIVAVAAPAKPHAQGKGAQPRIGRKPSPSQKKHEACVVNADDGIEELSPFSWSVKRDVVDYYATHIRELMKLGSVRAHREPDGKLRGFRVGLSKCSLLREGGLRSGDVVRDVNGVEVHDIFGAIGTYFRLRKQEHFELNVVRRGKEMVLQYDLI